nr:hypothetical protein [Catenibacterium mitsuokai]
MSKEFNTLEELHKKYPWNTPSKFIPLAKKYGFTVKDTKEFLQNKVQHDEKVDMRKIQYAPIFSQEPGGYQMDIMFDKKKAFLICININTKKGYVYPIASRQAAEVVKALNKFFSDVSVKTLMSDQDSTFLSAKVLELIKEKGITYRTTEDNNHNILGVINRFIRTLRDMTQRQPLTDEMIKEAVETYNKSPHSALNGKSPDEITEDDELNIIASKQALMRGLIKKSDFKLGDRVRVVLEKNKIGKRGANLSKVSYIIDEIDGINILIKANDDSTDWVQFYKLRKCDDRYPIADTIKDAKRGVIKRIISYDTENKKYFVHYEGDNLDKIPPINLRETMPTRLSNMERKFWAKKSEVPDEIKKWA